MINYHPSEAVLKEFVAGNLSVSVAMIVSSHVEMCDECRDVVQHLTERAAIDAFDTDQPLDIDDFQFDFDDSDAGFLTQDSTEQHMLNAITELPIQVSDYRKEMHAEIEVSGCTLTLPRAIKSIALKEWQGLGKVSRARLNLDDDERRMSLLHIDKGGNVPTHTHKGFEITLLLQGSFEDEMGTYQAGDFIWLDKNHTHNPVTQEGCICLTVSSDALRFTQGVSQIFNPLGKLIY